MLVPMVKLRDMRMIMRVRFPDVLGELMLMLMIIEIRVPVFSAPSLHVDGNGCGARRATEGYQ